LPSGEHVLTPSLRSAQFSLSRINSKEIRGMTTGVDNFGTRSEEEKGKRAIRKKTLKGGGEFPKS